MSMSTRQPSVTGRACARLRPAAASPSDGVASPDDDDVLERRARRLEQREALGAT